MKNLKESKYFKISVSAIATIAISYVAILILGQSGNFLRGLFGGIVWIFNVIAPMILGMIFAYLLMPIMDFFDRLLGKIKFFSKRDGFRRGISVFLTFAMIFILLFALLSLIISTFTSKIQFVTIDELSGMIQYIGVQAYNFYENLRKALLSRFDIAIPSIENMVNAAKKNISNIDSKSGVGYFTSFGSGLLGAVNTVKNTVVNFFFGVIFSIYFMYDSKIYGYWKNAFKSIFGDKVYGVCAEIVGDLDKCFAGYIRGQLADAIFMIVVVSISFGIAGVPYAALIGVATGIGNLVPYVGPFVAYGMTIVSCAMNGQFKMLAIGIVIIFIIQTIDGNIVNPKLLSNSVNVHPVLVIVALLFGGSIGGFIGMLVSVPVAAFIKIQFDKLLKNLEIRRGHRNENK